MQRSKLFQHKAGFTLVEVALAVAVGLVIIGGAVLGYNSVKDNASNSTARNRVLSAVTTIEEFSAANNGVYPASNATAGAGQFTRIWNAKRADDKAVSPWGGSTGNATYGVTELAAASFGSATAPASAPAIATGAFAAPSTGAAQAANIMYVSNTTSATPWGAVEAYSTQSDLPVKNYAVGIFDKNGANPWWDVKGGK